jgi:hypothetical protein
MRKYLMIGLLAFMVALAGVASATWVGDFMKAGIAVTEDQLTFNSDVEFDSAVDVGSTIILDDHLYDLNVSAVDNGDGTANATIQAVNAEGTNMAEPMMIHLWTSDTELAAVSALTGITVDTGTELTTIAANGEALIVSDDTGLIELSLDNGGAGTFWLNADFGGFIFTDEITVTAP